MIRVNDLCSECKNFKGIANKGEEMTEYIKCSAAKSDNAEELLTTKGKKFRCPRFDELE